jgi:hypothetical protein
MSRRASLPGAAELFRATSTAAQPEADNVSQHPGAARSQAAEAVFDEGDKRTESGSFRHIASAAPLAASPASPVGATRSGAVRNTRRIRAVGDRAPSGRELHEEKITVYCSPEELLDLERARLHLRAEHGLAVDRGRIVREAVAVVLADLEAKGESSILVRRLREA